VGVCRTQTIFQSGIRISPSLAGRNIVLKARSSFSGDKVDDRSVGRQSSKRCWAELIRAKIESHKLQDQNNWPSQYDVGVFTHEDAAMTAAAERPA
jgi:hypothetical protein